MHRLLAVCGITMLGYVSLTTVFGSDLDYKTLTIPGVAGAVLTGINDSGQMSGSGGSGEIQVGFVMDPSGTVTTIFRPGSSATTALGLNSVGQVVGSFDGMGGRHAYVETGGQFTTLTVPGSVGSSQATGVNVSGSVVGNFTAQGVATGFLYSSGVFTSISYAGAAATMLSGVNDSGQVVGTYFDSNGASHAFMYVGGIATPIALSKDETASSATGINNAGVITGTITTPEGTEGFIDGDGTLELISYPGASGTMVSGINGLGEIVGAYYDSAGISHAFEATPSSSPGAEAPEPVSVGYICLAALLSAVTFSRVKKDNSK